jgi:hypothetical protein
MVIGDLTYSSRIVSLFISQKLNVVGNVEVCYLKSVKLKLEVLEGASVDCVEPMLNNVFLIRSGYEEYWLFVNGCTCILTRMC